LVTCFSDAGILQSTERSGGFSENVINLGKFEFKDGDAKRQIIGVDSVYTIAPHSTAFFKLQFDVRTIEQVKQTTCDPIGRGPDIISNAAEHEQLLNLGGVGALWLVVHCINPWNGDTVPFRLMINGQPLPRKNVGTKR